MQKFSLMAADSARIHGKIDGIKYCLDGKDLPNFKSQDTNTYTIAPNSLLTMYSL